MEGKGRDERELMGGHKANGRGVVVDRRACDGWEGLEWMGGLQ